MTEQEERELQLSAKKVELLSNNVLQLCMETSDPAEALLALAAVLASIIVGQNEEEKIDSARDILQKAITNYVEHIRPLAKEFKALKENGADLLAKLSESKVIH